MRYLRSTFLLSIFAFGACSNPSNPHNIQKDANEKRPQMFNEPYRELDQMALVEVAAADADAALSGDANLALKIASDFAQLNKFQEARYWFQIAAENGSPIGMQNLSASLRKSDCRRANYWLKKYLSFDDSVVGKDNRVLFNASLKTYEAECLETAVRRKE